MGELSDVCCQEETCYKDEERVTEERVSEWVEELAGMPEIILAVGSHHTVIGHDHYNPRYMKRTVMSEKCGKEGKYLVWEEALAKQDEYSLVRPVRHGKIEDWELFSKYIQRCFVETHQSKDLSKVALVLPSFWYLEDVLAYASMLFSENFAVGAISVLDEAVCAKVLHSCNLKCIVLDIGAETCCCTTIDDMEVYQTDMIPLGLYNVCEAVDFDPFVDLLDNPNEIFSLIDAPTVKSGDDPYQVLFSEEGIFSMLDSHVEQMGDEKIYISVCGGGGMNLPGMTDRIESEVQQRYPGRKFRVNGALGSYVSWLGAQVIFSDVLTPSDFIMRDEFRAGNTDKIKSQWSHRPNSSGKSANSTENA